MSLRDLAEESLNRASAMLQNAPAEQPRVCLAVRCGQAGRLAGVADVLDLLRLQGGSDVTVRGKSDGDGFEPGETVMLVEGPLGRLAGLETEYLGLLSLSAGASRMAALVEAAGDTPVIDASARCHPPELQPRLGVAAAVGGAAGTITRAAHAQVHTRFGVGSGQIRVGGGPARAFGLHGTVPDTLHAAHGGSSVESAAAYHERFPKVPLVVPIDFEGMQRDVISAAVQRFHMDLHAVRLEIPDDRLHQGGHDKALRALEMRILSKALNRAEAMEALGRHGFGPGLTIESVYATRDLLDSLNSKHTKIFVVGDFDVERVRAFKSCGAPVDLIATASWVAFSRFRADVVRVWVDEGWKEYPKSAAAGEPAALPDLPVLLHSESRV